MKVIYRKAYSYILMNEGESWYLTFFTGGPVELDICVELTEVEAAKVCQNQEAVEELVRKFKSDRSSFEGRRVIPSKKPAK